MGKVRFRLWFHRLTINIRIKGVHHIKIKRSLPALVNSPPANPAHSHSLVQYDISNSTPIQLSSVNHKALDIAYPCASPARRASHSNSPKLSPLRPITSNLLNSPLMAHPIIPRSQPHPAAGRNSRHSAKSRPASIRREVRSSAVDCGCRPSLASSFRKTKENLQACSTGGVQSSSKYPLRQARKTQPQEEETSSFAYLKGKKVASKSTQGRAAGQKPESSLAEKKDSDIVASLSVNNTNNKKHRNQNLHRKLQYDNAMVEKAAYKQDNMKANPSHNGAMQAKLQEDDITRDGGKVNTSDYSMEELGKLEPTSSDNFRLSCSSSLADSAVLDAQSFNLWDKEFSSFTSTEDTFFSSFERSRPSFSSNSSSDVFDKLLVIDPMDRKMGMGHKIKLPQGSLLSSRDHGHSRKAAERVPSFRLSDFDQADLDSVPPLSKPGKGLLHWCSTNKDRLNGSAKRINRSPLSHGACSFSASAESTDHGLGCHTKSTSKNAAESNEGIKEDMEVCHEENLNISSAEHVSPSSASSCRSDTGDCGDDASSTNSCSNQFCDSTTSILYQSKGSRRRKKYTKRGGAPNSIRRRAQLQARWDLSENQIHWQYSDDPLSSSVSSTPNRAVARTRGNSRRKEHIQQQNAASTDGEEDYSIAISKLNEKFRHSKGTASSSTRVKESVAVVKSSRDPLVDFRDSMVDMILEKQIYSAPELEELLQCFLALNTADQHDTIVRAFTQVWEKVFDNLKTHSRTCSM